MGDLVPTRVVACVVRRSDELLVCQRPAHKRHGGLWEFAGGKIEPGESDAQAAARELREELGVQLVHASSPLREIADLGSPYIIVFVPVEILGDPEPLEHSAFRWATIFFSMKTYFARLLPPRPNFVMDMTDTERQLMQAHAHYWRGMLDQGRAVTFGLVLDPKGAFGIGVLEVPDDADVNTLTDGDPTIQANVGFRYEVSPMPMGAVHR